MRATRRERAAAERSCRCRTAWQSWRLLPRGHGTTLDEWLNRRVNCAEIPCVWDYPPALRFLQDLSTGLPGLPLRGPGHAHQVVIATSAKSTYPHGLAPREDPHASARLLRAGLPVRRRCRIRANRALPSRPPRPPRCPNRPDRRLAD